MQRPERYGEGTRRIISLYQSHPDWTWHDWRDHLTTVNDSKRESDYLSNAKKIGAVPREWVTQKSMRMTVPSDMQIHDFLIDAATNIVTDAPRRIEDLFSDTRHSIPARDAAWELEVDPYGLRQMITDARSRGIEIAEIDGTLHYGVVQDEAITPLADNRIVFGIMSDLHYGAKACQLTAIKKFVNECKAEGVTHILIPGDVTDGAGIYKGQDLEQYATTADAQEASVIRNLPQVTGIQYIALGGNHDESFMKAGRGHNPLRAIERQREDFRFIGFTRKKVPLLPGVDAVLWHGGRPAYAKSYPLQKHVANISFDELRKVHEGEASTVRFLFGGHLHIYAEIMDGGIMSMMCGAFAGANGLTAAMGVDPIIRGIIVWAELDKRGKLRRIRTDKLDYPEIADDWKNYKHEPEDTAIDKPLFGG